ncbi:hypothetical protein ACIP2Z_19450 [Streptomyces iakyrus]|uniref:Uncharacterized protein n=1 Tax=Streptomyces iakyrus TaxID=68219 RepID=A0ABW8FGE9_9ACTN
MTATHAQIGYLSSAASALNRLSVEDRASLQDVLQHIAEKGGCLLPEDRKRLRLVEQNLAEGGTYCEVQINESLVVGLKLFRREDVFHVRVLVIGTPTIDYFAALVEQALAAKRPGTQTRERGGSARGTVGLAARLAGRDRSHLRSEWMAVLAGAPEEGVTFSSGRQFLLALGFLLAAVRMRSYDLARPMWRPVDWLLRTESRTNGFIAIVVGGQAVYIVDDGGLSALFTEVWEPCGIAGAALYVLSRWLRRVRGIEVATPERGHVDG